MSGTVDGDKTPAVYFSVAVGAFELHPTIMPRLATQIATGILRLISFFLFRDLAMLKSSSLGDRRVQTNHFHKPIGAATKTGTIVFSRGRRWLTGCRAVKSRR